ncbi:MAG TPA: DUF3298 domain-containing protein [Candidatus Paceibacterota bacterium]|nr:DUF3298 domain-containing protein [Candidatus Paceibacterota bacterium]
MSIRTGLFVIVLAVLVAIGGWYVFTHTQSLPHELNENGDRQVKEDTDYYTIQAIYPNATRLATRTDSSANADKRAVSAIESWINQSISSFKSDTSKMLSADEKARLMQANEKYALDIAYHPYNSGSFVSEEFDIYEDTGGAHPNSSYKTLVFDLKGNQVSLGDLFTPGTDYLGRIAAEAKTQVDAQVAQRIGADATSTIFADGLAPKEENFANWVDDQGILTIFIPPYQAAAYAAGSFEVHIPLTDLKDILKQGVQ